MIHYRREVGIVTSGGFLWRGNPCKKVHFRKEEVKNMATNDEITKREEEYIREATRITEEYKKGMQEIKAKYGLG